MALTGLPHYTFLAQNVYKHSDCVSKKEASRQQKKAQKTVTFEQ